MIRGTPFRSKASDCRQPGLPPGVARRIGTGVGASSENNQIAPGVHVVHEQQQFAESG